MNKQYSFDFEGHNFALRKSTGIELWVDGKHVAYYCSKINSFKTLYENMLRINFGKYGQASVNSVLKIHNRVDEEFHIFLDKVGEEWK